MSFDAYPRVAKHAALSEVEALLDVLAALEESADELAEALRRHHLAPLVAATLPESLRARLPAPRRQAIERHSRPSLDPALLLGAYRSVRDELAAADVPVLLLKGVYFAQRLYGGLGRRPQFDVDLLLRRRDHHRALRLLRERGFRRKDYDQHSTTLVHRDVKLDVHRFLRWAPAFRLDERLVWEDTIDVTIEETSIRTLGDEHTLVLLVLSAFEDLGQGMAKLKQLLDLYLLARELDAGFDWSGFLARRRAENLDRVAAVVLRLTVELFEGGDEVARLRRALTGATDIGSLADRGTALRLLSAARKSPDSLVWFGRVYPGSMALYLAWFWWGGFPANLRRLGPSWLRSLVRLATAGPDRSRGTA